MTVTEMGPDEFRKIQTDLGLTDRQMAEMLGFENPQHVQRLKAAVGASHAKRVMPGTARLMFAYRDGYRPDDWPTDLRHRPVEYVTRSEFDEAVRELQESVRMLDLLKADRPKAGNNL